METGRNILSIDGPAMKIHSAFMKHAVFALLVSGLASFAQETNKDFVGTEQPAVVIEHFVLTGSRVYDGIWDSTKSQIHIVQKTNHVGDVTVSKDEILLRRTIGDGSQVKLYSEMDMAEKVLLLQQKNFKVARDRVVTVSIKRSELHNKYYHSDKVLKTELPPAEYKALSAQFKAFETERVNATAAMVAAEAAFKKAYETYQKAGGKKQYKLEI